MRDPRPNRSPATARSARGVSLPLPPVEEDMDAKLGGGGHLTQQRKAPLQRRDPHPQFLAFLFDLRDPRLQGGEPCPILALSQLPEQHNDLHQRQPPVTDPSPASGGRAPRRR